MHGQACVTLLLSLLLPACLLHPAWPQDNSEVLARRAAAEFELGRKTNDINVATQYFREAAQDYRDAHQIPQEAEVFRAMMIRHADSAKEVLPEAQQLVALDRNILHPPLSVLTKDTAMLATAYYNARQFAPAFATLDEAIRLAQQSGNILRVAAYHLTKANMYNFRGQMNQAVAEQQTAVRFAIKAGSCAARLKAAVAHTRREFWLLDKESIGRWAQWISSYCAQMEAAARTDMGMWLFEKGEQESGLWNLHHALYQAQQLDMTLNDFDVWNRNRLTLADCLADQADIYQRLGYPHKALVLYREACQANLAGTADHLYQCYDAMADIYAASGRPGADALAEAYYEMVLLPNPIDPFNGFTARVGYGGYLVHKGRYQEALNLFRRALFTAKQASTFDKEADCLNRMGSAYLALHDPHNALNCFQASAKVTEENVPIPDLQWKAHYGLGLAWMALHHAPDALQEYNKAIEILNHWLHGLPQSPAEPIRLDSSLWEPYHDAMLAYMNRRGSKSVVFRLSEQEKAGLLTLAARQLDLNKWLTAQERAYEHHLRDEIDAGLQRNTSYEARELKAKRPQDFPAWKAQNLADLHRAETEYETLWQAIYRRHPDRQAEMKAARVEMPRLDLRGAMAVAAKAHATILDYVLTESKAFAFLIDSQGASVVPLKTPIKQLRENMEELSRNPENANPHPTVAGSLYKALITPLEGMKSFQQARSLCIIPDGVLWRVPFEMLWQHPTKSQPQYLIERFPISYAPSVAALQMMLDRERSFAPRHAWRAAFLGGPLLDKAQQMPFDLFRGGGFHKILAPELQKAPHLFHNPVIYVGARATRQAARNALETCDLVHFGCDGRYNDAEPLRSALALTHGQLTASDLAGWPIRSRLVFLAACETGRGEPVVGQGLLGMTWAAFVGGAPTCIATRWQ